MFYVSSYLNSGDWSGRELRFAVSHCCCSRYRAACSDSFMWLATALTAESSAAHSSESSRTPCRMFAGASVLRTSPQRRGKKARVARRTKGDASHQTKGPDQK